MIKENEHGSSMSAKQHKIKLKEKRKTKMKTIKLILISLCLTVPVLVPAQISPKVIKRFPASIIYQIDMMSSKITLNEEKQIKIGEKLFKRDSLANTALSKGRPVSELKKYYVTEKTFFKGICSQEEIEEFFYRTDPDNRFLAALKSASLLKLTPDQITRIRQQNEAADSVIINDFHKKIQFYNAKLESVLDKVQFAALIKKIYSSLSAEETKRDWKNILNYKLASSRDSSIVYTQLYNYNLTVNAVVDPQSEKLGIIKNREVRNALMLYKQPAILTRYNILADGPYKTNLFSTAIKYGKDLELNPSQTDSILSKYKDLEITKLKDEKNYQTIYKKNEYALFENKTTTNILEARQVEKLLLKKNEKAASHLAVNNWEELEQLGLTKGLDKTSNLKEFIHYHLNFLIASDKVKMNNNAANIFSRRDAELKKPELLKQLDALQKSRDTAKSTKNDLKW